MFRFRFRKFRFLSLIMILILLLSMYLIRRPTKHLTDTELRDIKYRLKLAQNRTNSYAADTKFVYFGSHWWHLEYPFLKAARGKCPKCVFTNTFHDFRHRIHLEMSDAVVFHGCYLEPKPPENNRTDQIWVYLMFEAPMYLGKEVRRTANYTNMFNWTMTYRLDSDVPTPYGRFVPFTEMPAPKLGERWAFLPSAIKRNGSVYDPNFMKIPTLKQIRNKTKLVAWIATHCATHSKRESIVAGLAKYIPIDIYGKCGNMACEVSKKNAHSGIDCRFQISSQYKFYLAFENSLCEDYVTEKFWETLHTQMVPVVYGGANYSNLYPKRSFINVADFQSLKELADYLNYLDGNLKEYRKYFRWRKKYWVMNNRFVEGYCTLCQMLWDKRPKMPKSYNNLTAWWFGRSDFSSSQESACFNPPKIISINASTLTTSTTTTEQPARWPIELIE